MAEMFLCTGKIRLMEDYLDDQLNDADDELAELQDKYALGCCAHLAHSSKQPCVTQIPHTFPIRPN